MTEAYIYDAVRTPRGKGKKDGALHSVKPIDLVVGLLKALQERNQLDTAQVDDVVLGCVTPIGDQGSDIAKTAVLAADWAECVSGVQLNRFCASGLEAVNIGAMKVRSGFEDLVVVGGVESMSRIPMGSDGGAWALDPATNMQANFVPQGVGADLIASIEGFSRTDVDSFALRSQQKAARASADGSFNKSLIPVTDQNGIVILDHDEFIRGDSTLDALGKLKPSFEMMGQMGFDATAQRKYSHVERIEHVHTPGNSSGIVDGAALMLIGSEAKGRELGLKARGRIVATAVTSTDPTIMLTGPAPATRKALAKA
ncbi:acetyl-CoA C-acetyltransferase, partial [Pseudomonas sp. Gutcm_11s]|uniref:acetyl-CoA C-acetyltransferase n=1 Tax=Pseudomonas sp. Gutcm_11s TaxID=3026088 RepID=UPI0023628496